jgi:hypothetical protein
MILSLNEAEKFLIEKNLITQHELQELKEKSRIGRLNCKALGRFIRAVKEDYSQIFSKKPCAKNFVFKAKKLN